MSTATPTGVDPVLAVHRDAAPWPYQAVDVRELTLLGWRPRPFRDVVLKVHQRCNLACDYCYVYEKADQSWRSRPAVMAPPIWRAAVDRIANHVRAHRLTSIRIVLHGGEPLLFGTGRLTELADAVRAALPETCAADIGMQTNGVRLDPKTLSELARHQIRVGVSVDGVAEVHDLHRRMPNGRGSFAAVRRGLELLGRPEYRSIYAGILCTVAADTDPMLCYKQLLEFDPPMIDFLLPHANWNELPLRASGSPTAYAEWLIPIFDEWYDTPAPPRVRLFENIVNLLLGGRSGSEQIGLSPAAMLVVESNGEIEQVDALKTAYEGACATGLSVLENEFDEALRDPGVVARQIGVRALASECLACEFRNQCGGGHYAHRYRAGEGFRNRSVYCDDMKRLIGHVRNRMARDFERLEATGAL
jgi:uncharacterized protein